MLEEVYKSYRALADEINWKSYDQNELFFEYLKHKNEPIKDNFYAGIICRYWGYTGKLYLKVKKNIPFEECYDVLIDTINYLLEKHVWDNPESSLYKDPKGPEKAFHFVLKRQLSLLLASKNASKRKSNFNTLSIDELHEKYSDSSDGLFNLVDSEQHYDLYDYIKTLPTSFDRVVVDIICFSQWSSINNIATKLKKIGPENFQYYNSLYEISEPDFNSALKYIEDISVKNLTKEVKKLLYTLKSDWK